jgi:hypothetical protein
MELNRVSEKPCPQDIIAIAINGNNRSQHCGLIYTDAANRVRLCDMQWEKELGVRTPDPAYFWTRIRLATDEISLASEFIDLIIEKHFYQKRIPYSFLHSRDGFDVTGAVRTGVGVTCATFVINVFDRLQLQLLDVSTWKPRPKQDAAFRNRIIDLALRASDQQFAQRLASENTSFRIKPWEVYGSATHTKYPVKFVQAVKLARIVSKLVRKRKSA